MKTLHFLFGMKERVSRKPYIRWGLTLFALKYMGEAFAYYLVQNHFLSPISFLSPLLQSRYPGSNFPDWFIPTLILWSLPFIWIGVGMSIRRAADANLSPWLGILFFVPVLNYILMMGLAIAPSSSSDSWNAHVSDKKIHRFISPLAVTCVFALCGTLLTWYTTNFLREYAVSLFIGFPLILGLVQGYFLTWSGGTSATRAALHAMLTILLIYLFLLVFALEGLICMLMAFPLSGALAAIGAMFGSRIAKYSNSHSNKGRVPVLLILALPALPLAETNVPKTHHDVVLSTIEIHAEPEKVWPNVVKFSDLPPTHDWLFHLGIAYPIRARIDGQGVGAVRHCEFSTGAFVEPITNWDAPNRLAFTVKYQPQPMKELSFYDHVDAPHLDGYFRSVNGEFRLTRVGPGMTRLEGRTWYEIDMQPGWYWQFYGRWFIHKIHMRVLSHIKSLSET
jgi:uncharacterized membrane protein YhaH (DUF805 family)